MADAARKSYGPYDVIDQVSIEGRELVAIPFDSVKGCQILCSVVDSISGFVTFGAAIRFIVGAEIEIWGVIQNYQTPLKRQFVTQRTGPMDYIFPYEEAYDLIQIRARNKTGGKSRSAVLDQFTSVNGFFLRVNLLINPRTGFDKKDGLTRDKPPMNWG